MSESVRLIYSNGHELARPMMESDVSKNAIILATMDYQVSTIAYIQCIVACPRRA